MKKDELFESMRDLEDHRKTISYYIDVAKRCNGIKSDRELSERLKLSSNTVGNWRRGKSLPSLASMVKLADLGGENRELALTILQMIRLSKDTELYTAAEMKVVRKTYTNILEKVAQADSVQNIKKAAVVLIMAIPLLSVNGVANASTLPSQDLCTLDSNVNVYYGKRYVRFISAIRRSLRLFKDFFFNFNFKDADELCALT